MKRLLTNTAIALATLTMMLIVETIEVQHYPTPSETLADGNPMPPPPATSRWMLADGNPMPPPPKSQWMLADGNPMPPHPAESKQSLTRITC